MASLGSLSLLIGASLDPSFTGATNQANSSLGSIRGQFSALKTDALKAVSSGYALGKAYASAANTLKAQGEVATLGVTKDGIDAITKAGQDMSIQFGQISAPEFIKASYDIKSGISALSEGGVKDFTRMAAVTAVATKSSTAEMTKLYALGYSIFRQDFSSDNNFGKQFSGAISSAVKAFRTDGSDLSQGLSNIGSDAKAMGVSLAEELAIIGIAKETFNTASEAGTKYRAFLTNAGKAQDELGLKFTDSNDKMLPMVDILALIKGKFGETISTSEKMQLDKAFGSTEATGLIVSLLNKTDKLTEAQNNLQTSMKKGMSTATEMAKAADTGYGFEKLDHSTEYLAFTFGKHLEPVVNTLASGVGMLASGIDSLDQVFPVLIPSLMWGAAAMSGLYVITTSMRLASLALSFAKIGETRSMIFSAATTSAATVKTLYLSTVSKTAAASQWLLNTAMSANPVSLLVAGIVALGAGAIYLYKNFEPFTLFIDSTWTKLKGFFSFVANGWGKVGGIVSKLGGVLGFGGGDKNQQASLATIKPNNPEMKKLNIPKITPSTGNQNKVMQSNTITVHINNPTDNVQVTEAVTRALESNAKSGVSLMDVNI